MQAHNQRGFHRQQIRQGTVVQVRSDNVVEGNLSAFIAEAEGTLFPEIKAARSNEVLRVQSGRSQPLPVETERRLIVHMKHVIHDFQAFLAVQRRSRNTQALEIVHQINLNALQPGLGLLDVVGINAEGDILRFRQTVISLGELTLKHFRVFLADIVKAVVLIGDNNRLLEALSPGSQVQERKLKMDAGIEVVQEIAPAFEDRRFIVVLRQLIIDILELNGLGIVLLSHPADPIGPHPLIWNGSLGRSRLLLVGAVPLQQLFQLLFFRLGELEFFLFLSHGESSSPLSSVLRRGQSRRKSYRSHRDESGAA